MEKGEEGVLGIIFFGLGDLISSSLRFLPFEGSHLLDSYFSFFFFLFSFLFFFFFLFSFFFSFLLSRFGMFTTRGSA